MPTCILKIRINNVTLQAICCERDANEIISVQQCKESPHKEASMLCPAWLSYSNAFSKMAYNVGDNGSPYATPWSVGNKSNFCPFTTTRLLLPWYRFLISYNNTPHP